MNRHLHDTFVPSERIDAFKFHGKFVQLSVHDKRTNDGWNIGRHHSVGSLFITSCANVFSFLPYLSKQFPSRGGFASNRQRVLFRSGSTHQYNHLNIISVSFLRTKFYLKYIKTSNINIFYEASCKYDKKEKGSFVNLQSF